MFISMTVTCFIPVWLQLRIFVDSTSPGSFECLQYFSVTHNAAVVFMLWLRHHFSRLQTWRTQCSKCVRSFSVSEKQKNSTTNCFSHLHSTQQCIWDPIVPMSCMSGPICTRTWETFINVIEQDGFILKEKNRKPWLTKECKDSPFIYSSHREASEG